MEEAEVLEEVVSFRLELGMFLPVGRQKYGWVRKNKIFFYLFLTLAVLINLVFLSFMQTFLHERPKFCNKPARTRYVDVRVPIFFVYIPA